MIDAPFALAFAAGMVATVNPCGFAMLPAYLSYFLGIDQTGGGPARVGLVRAVHVALAVSAGFLVLFAAVGFAIRGLSLPVEEYSPWVSIVIGVALVVLGIAMLRGFELSLRLPRLQKGGGERTARSMFLFGMSYATVSIGCTTPTFLATVVGTMRRENFASGVATFAAYGVGMTLVLMALTTALALTRQSLVRFLRRSQRYVTRVAGALLLVAGAYVAYYGWYELQVLDGDTPPAGPVDAVTGISDDISAWVNDTGALRVGLALSLAMVAVLVAVTGTRARRID